VSFVSRYRVNSPQAVKEAVLAGLGIGLLPLYVCADEIKSGQLIRVLPHWLPQTKFGTKVFAVGLPERVRLSRCQTLLKYLKAALAS
jgi:DNA-binding transcriptional LysR family regulator